MITQDTKRVVVESLIAKHGIADPAHLVAEARAPDHPAHDAFEWDNSEAAHAYRLEQARVFIRSVKLSSQMITYEQKSIRLVQTQAYVSSPAGWRDGGGYRPFEDMLGDPIELAAMRSNLLSRLEALLGQLETLSGDEEAERWWRRGCRLGRYCLRALQKGAMLSPEKRHQRLPASVANLLSSLPPAP